MAKELSEEENAKVTYIDINPFRFCTSLTDIWVNSGNGQYVSVNGVLMSADMETLIAFPAGRK